MRTTATRAKGWRDWPTRDEVLKQYDVTPSKLGAMCRHGKLKAYSCRDGSVRFDPDQLDECLEPRPEPSEETSSTGNPEPTPLERALQTTIESLKATIALLNDIISGLRSEKERLVEALINPSKQLLEALNDTRKSDRERTAHLETIIFDAIKAREQAMTEEHDRKLFQWYLEQEAKRKSDALDFAKHLAPQVLSKFRLSGASKKAAEVLERVDPDLINFAVEAGVITREQADELLWFRDNANKQPKNDTKPESPAGERAGAGNDAPPGPSDVPPAPREGGNPEGGRTGAESSPVGDVPPEHQQREKRGESQNAG